MVKFSEYLNEKIDKNTENLINKIEDDIKIYNIAMRAKDKNTLKDAILKTNLKDIAQDKINWDTVYTELNEISESKRSTMKELQKLNDINEISEELFNNILDNFDVDINERTTLEELQYKIIKLK